MVDLFRPEAQTGVSPFDNTSVGYSDVVTAHPSKRADYSKDDKPQKWGFPSGNELWATRNSDQLSFKPPAPEIHVARRTSYLNRNDHLITNYLNGTKIDEYYGEGYHEKTVWKPDGSWRRFQNDWKHGKALFEEHDASGVFKSLETPSRWTTSLHDSHGKLVFEVRKNLLTGDTTLIEPGPGGRLVTKYYRLA